MVRTTEQAPATTPRERPHAIVIFSLRLMFRPMTTCQGRIARTKSIVADHARLRQLCYRWGGLYVPPMVSATSAKFNQQNPPGIFWSHRKAYGLHCTNNSIVVMQENTVVVTMHPQCVGEKAPPTLWMPQFRSVQVFVLVQVWLLNRKYVRRKHPDR
jgi:hypothetical protein